MGQRVSCVHDACRLAPDVTRLEMLLSSPDRAWDVNEVRAGRTALFNAVYEERREVVAALLRHGADVNVKCSLQREASHEIAWTALHEACRLGSVDVLKLLLAVSRTRVNLVAHHQMSPLHVAAWHGHRDVIHELLQTASCDVNHMDQFRESAIVVPICTGDTAVVEQLLVGGCKLNSRGWGNLRKIGGKHDCDFRDHLYGRDGPYSLFTLAIKFSWLNIAGLLLCHGFNANKYQLSDILALVKESTGRIDSEEAQQLVTCLLEAGYKMRTSASVEHVAELCSHSDCGHLYVDLLRKKAEQPERLKQLCRTAIRVHLRTLGAYTSIVGRVPRTGLPRELQDYVNLAEFCEWVHQAESVQDTSRHLLYFAMPRRRDRGTKPLLKHRSTKATAKSKKTGFW